MPREATTPRPRYSKSTAKPLSHQDPLYRHPYARPYRSPLRLAVTHLQNARYELSVNRAEDHCYWRTAPAGHQVIDYSFDRSINREVKLQALVTKADERIWELTQELKKIELEIQREELRTRRVVGPAIWNELCEALENF